MGLKMFNIIKKYAVFVVIGALLGYAKLWAFDWLYWAWFIPILTLIYVRDSVMIDEAMKNENI